MSNEHGAGAFEWTRILPRADAVLVDRVWQVPRIARWFFPAHAVLWRGTTSSTVERRLRSLLVLRMAAFDESDYWLAQQRPVATEVGISEDEQAAVIAGEWAALDTLSPSERAALRWCEAVATNDAKRDSAAFAELQEMFAIHEIVELTALIGMCALVDRVANALQLPPDPPSSTHVAAPVETSDLAQWADLIADDMQREDR